MGLHSERNQHNTATTTTTTSSFLIAEDWRPETPTQQIAIVLCLLPRGCSPLLTYPTSPGYRRSSAFWVDLCVLCRRYVHVALKCTSSSP